MVLVMEARHDPAACPCGQTDIIRRDPVTAAPLCFACSTALTGFQRWLRDDDAMAHDLGRMTFIYGSDAD